jgi:hypothetical protein
MRADAPRRFPEVSMPAPRTLICGSLAFDTIMVFPAVRPPSLADGPLPRVRDRGLRREWAVRQQHRTTCGLGGEPVMRPRHDGGLTSAARTLRIAADGVRTLPDFTAQAFITDHDDNRSPPSTPAR